MSVDTILTGLPLLNILLIWFFKPLYEDRKRFAQTVENQQQEIKELRELNEILREEVRLLKELVFKTIQPEQLQAHLLCHISDKPKDKK